MISEPEVTEQTAHTVLNYCLTMATRKNKNYKFKVQIPWEVLARSCGLPEEVVNEFLGSALELNATLKWVEQDFGEVSLDAEDVEHDESN